MPLEGDVWPLTSRRLGFAGRQGDELGPDPMPAERFGHDRVEDERHSVSVPGDVDGPDEPTLVPGADPAVKADVRQLHRAKTRWSR